MENLDHTDKKRNLLLLVCHGLFPEEQKRMLKGNKKNKWLTIYRPAHPQRSQNKTEKSSHGIDWQQNGLWYNPTNMDDSLIIYKISGKIINLITNGREN